jgi:hypothetical protein
MSYKKGDTVKIVKCITHAKAVFKNELVIMAEAGNSITLSKPAHCGCKLFSNSELEKSNIGQEYTDSSIGLESEKYKIMHKGDLK